MSTVVVFFIFTTEVSLQIYINYRANPPGVNCEAITDSFAIEQIGVTAYFEYLYEKEHRSGTLTEKIS